jgi:hypothetical protein
MASKIMNMLKNIWNIIKTLCQKREDMPPLIKALKTAKQEWQFAQKMYNEVLEPELTDYASYLIKAHETHYIYLLRQVKQEGLCLSSLKKI